ncbi:MAG: M1 family aminopeptidase [Candidatus Omnitrophota bacterium]
MKKIFIYLAAALLFIGSIGIGRNLLAQQIAQGGWQKLEGEHFVVYFKTTEEKVKGILKDAEVYYANIANEIGYPRYSEFWLWDKRVKIYIYPDHRSFLASSNQPNWSHGMANYTEKFIAGYESDQEFLDSILPHEIAHLIFRDFIGFKGEIRLWLDEGVAQWAEERTRENMKETVRIMYATNRLLKMKDMMKMNLGDIAENRLYIKDTIDRNSDLAILVVDGNSMVKTYYIQSFSMIGFLIEKYGSTRFAEFCRQLRDARSIEDSLRLAYPFYIRDLDELEKKWREYLEEDFKKHGGE